MKPIQNNTAYLTIRKNYTLKDGTSQILLRVLISGRKKDIGLSEYCIASFWDFEKEQVNKNYPKAEAINLVLRDKKRLAEDIIDTHKSSKLGNLTLAEFEKEFGFKEAPCFIKFAENEIVKEKKRGERAPATIVCYNKELNKLKKFKPTFKFEDITNDFLDKYESYLRFKLENRKNTIHQSFKFIRGFLYKAIDAGLTDNNPFRKRKLLIEETHIEYLNQDEVVKLTNYLKLIENRKYLHRTLKAFLFSCYTGLRFSDVSSLTYKSIQNNQVYLRMKKTNEHVSIPLIDEAIKLLELESSPFLERKIFDVPVNQISNRHLKTACKEAGINKRISFHCSRHTFATIGLTVGIPVETIQNLLGHKKIEQTMLYAKVVNEKVKSDMDKMNKAFNMANVV